METKHGDGATGIKRNRKMGKILRFRYVPYPIELHDDPMRFAKIRNPRAVHRKSQVKLLKLGYL